jgi:hypothetical protein
LLARRDPADTPGAFVGDALAGEVTDLAAFRDPNR